jgi:hypothetical protein
MNRLLLGLSAILVIAGAGAGGYVLGHSEAPTESDAAESRKAAYRDALRASRQGALARAGKRGRKNGLDQGRSAGERAGALAGTRDAAVDVEEAQADIAAAEAAAAAEEEVFCPLATDNSATQAECDALGAEEARCGGFDPDQVQPDGSYLPKPGC